MANKLLSEIIKFILVFSVALFLTYFILFKPLMNFGKITVIKTNTEITNIMEDEYNGFVWQAK